MTMKRLFLLIFVLLLAFSGSAFAVASDSPAEEVLLAADFQTLKESGSLFAGIAPGMTYEEAVAAGAALQDEPYSSTPSKADDADSPLNEVYYLEMSQVIALGDLRMGPASCFQFTDGKLVNVDLYLQEETALDGIMELISLVLGEPTEQTDNALGGVTVRWDFEVDEKIISLTALAANRENGLLCYAVSVTYRDLYWDLIDYESAAPQK